MRAKLFVYCQFFVICMVASISYSIFAGYIYAQPLIKYELLEDGVEHWYREDLGASPNFFQEIEKLFNIVFPNQEKLPFAKSIAFLVGVSEYKYLSPQLPFVKNDLEDMKNFLLGKGGFDEVYLASEGVASRDLIEDYMKNRFPKQLSSEDRLIFYYSGHGADSGGKTGYMQFSEAQPGNFAGNQVLAINDTTDWCYELKIDHLLFVFDCCASGLAFTPKGENTPSDQQLINTLSKNGSRVVITAGTAGEKTFEIQGTKNRGNGVFTRAFLNAVETGKGDQKKDGFITIEEIIAEVKKEIAYFSLQYNQSLTPRIWELDPGRYRGTFIFINPQAKAQNIVLKDAYTNQMGGIRGMTPLPSKNSIIPNILLGAGVIGGGVALGVALKPESGPSESSEYLEVGDIKTDDADVTIEVMDPENKPIEPRWAYSHHVPLTIEGYYWVGIRIEEALPNDVRASVTIKTHSEAMTFSGCRIRAGNDLLFFAYVTHPGGKITYTEGCYE